MKTDSENTEGDCNRDASASLAPASGSGTATSYHLCQSITGPLMNWKKSDWRKAVKYITRKDGSRYTPEELKMAFLDELAKGHEVIPIGKCDNFDWKDGCQGHRVESPNDRGEP